MKISKIFLLVLLFTFLTPALAYIGPGAGIPFIGSFIGFVVTVVLVISAILFWPIRKLLKNRKRNIENKIKKESK
jgi:F0F1-type ATP synthase membrane subunit b/b'